MPCRMEVCPTSQHNSKILLTYKLVSPTLNLWRHTHMAINHLKTNQDQNYHRQKSSKGSPSSTSEPTTHEANLNNLRVDLTIGGKITCLRSFIG